ncbi:MAG TPA: PTS system mannose/fructose/sorbose family transporter subunit IID [Gemmatimonadaceae bacterium]|nr:PTS system mannose/fructose/sorbose family transporter subunit IID [Gemmatimonadaceae bacterium]
MTTPGVASSSSAGASSPGGVARPAPPARRALPARTWIAMYVRLLAIQGSWNYETLMGNGVGFCTEPALRLLPGGRGGDAYRAALARQSKYFNAHPYLAAVAVGALARVEIDGEPPARIERFRTALCGPLGSVGDRLVWAGWLPFCSVVALAVFGLDAGPAAVVLTFLVLYNAGHLALRAWGLTVGWRRGMSVAPALANPVLRRGPEHIARVAALAAGAALPLALSRAIGIGRALTGGVAVAVVLGAVVVARLHGRAEGWRLALVALALFVLYSVVRHG